MRITQVAVTPPMLADYPESFAPLRERGIAVRINDGQYPMDAQSLARFVGTAEAAIIGLDEISAILFEMCPALRVVARNGVGMDNVDLAAASARGILVTTPLGANSTSVAELAIGLTITLARHVIPTHNRVQRGEWRRTQGMQLSGKTLGIVGLGRIGKKVAVRAQAFGMRVIANDIAPDAMFAAQHNIEMTGFGRVLEESDVVSLHVPLTDLTVHLIDRAALARMKPGALLINTARGPVIDSAALAEAITTGQLAGAALDVHTVEGRIDAVLAGLENVITTTHLGAYTRESLIATTEMAVDSILQILDGAAPIGLMNPACWPPRA
ncbi:MAG: 4-phosphoerythronate dehydrogenase [Chloroflexota bacterium]|nr:MAG: 4-phosphoerythronate dehydrogenase [Chloroflexota bacterium]